jgi:hypothetical protein
VVVKKKASTAQSVGAGAACISCLPACSSYTTINNIISPSFLTKINHIFHSAPGLAIFQTPKNKKGFFFFFLLNS